MFEMTNLILFCKAITIAQLSFLILNFLVRMKATTQGIFGSLFLSSLIAYFICPMLRHSEANPAVFLLVHVGCYSVSFFFYLFVSSLFVDRFRPSFLHGVSFLLINAFCFYVFVFSKTYYETSIFSKILFSAPQLIFLTLLLLALGNVLKDKNIDLIESRREFRVLFVFVTGSYAISVVLIELILKYSDYSAELDLVNSFLIMILVFFFSFKLFEFRENTFLIPDRKKEEPLDEVLFKKLNSLLEEEKIYLMENLTILKLAQKIGVSEKKIRRLINQGLDYRNFNEFLNHYRIREAKAILSDQTKNDIPVLRIAMDLGYGSLAPFNRAFKEIAGTTPSDFRKQVPQLKR
ncbi:AraC family transcriptional regulator [Leptospira sanjuanensis]|uniref:AraC family transcriptional regulator n=1 Tax=Leptospira sanjuanensis TaxID=2879643 RepID=UPI001EE94D57|nr:helix-turn-helix domain-containing protein [Leptospira sanjuanensis]MCG6169201.1 helix-turn-helix domain-containing protein [Leptospira sanjuanensis]